MRTEQHNWLRLRPSKRKWGVCYYLRYHHLMTEVARGSLVVDRVPGFVCNKKVLIACEQSQVVCAAFRRLGFEAYSNDILPCYGGHPEWHIIGDALNVTRGYGRFDLENGSVLIMPGYWDMIIAHPPCTMLTHASAVCLAKGIHSLADVEEGALFFWEILNSPTTLLAVENPAPMAVAQLPPYNQTVQPYQFGDNYSKRVCLWLRGLPPLLPRAASAISKGSWLDHCSSSSRRRSKTFEGIAQAMAEQWGEILKEI